MINESCLICNNQALNFKNWNRFKILICDKCLFSYIKIDKDQIEKEEVFSPSEESFINQSILSDKKRRDLFVNKIVKNRIRAYEKILKRKPLNILEVGCGTAVISDGFLLNGVQYTGVEFDKNFYNFAKSKSRNVVYGDFLKTNFEKKFDILFASQVVEHIDEPNIFFKKCNEVLKKDGILHIDVPNDRSLISCLRKIFKNNKYYGAIRPPYHMRAYSSNSLKKLFLKNNFYNIKTSSKINLDRTYGQLVEKLPFKIIFLFRLQQLIGMNSLLVGVAQKK
jgi:2-polyprenyl-3-methyl-5-hydroxy-6-metoxy-1,4-benzoquinol methylase